MYIQSWMKKQDFVWNDCSYFLCQIIMKKKNRFMFWSCIRFVDVVAVEIPCILYNSGSPSTHTIQENIINNKHRDISVIVMVLKIIKHHIQIYSSKKSYIYLVGRTFEIGNVEHHSGWALPFIKEKVICMEIEVLERKRIFHTYYINKWWILLVLRNIWTVQWCVLASALVSEIVFCQGEGNTNTVKQRIYFNTCRKINKWIKDDRTDQSTNHQN